LRIFTLQLLRGDFCNNIGTMQTYEIPAVFVRFSRHSQQFLANLRA
jgi:hypothetical protein